MRTLTTAATSVVVMNTVDFGRGTLEGNAAFRMPERRVVLSDLFGQRSMAGQTFKKQTVTVDLFDVYFAHQIALAPKLTFCLANLDEDPSDFNY